MLNRQWLVLSTLALAAPLGAQSTAVPKDGTAVLAQMHARYSTRWYKTLEFDQKTTIYGRNGVREEAWHERLMQHPTRGTILRIDRGDPSEGNSLYYTATSSYTVRAGKTVRIDGEGNFFLPLIEGVYLQPIEQTVKDLASTKVDLSKVSAGSWNGDRVWVVGAMAASDSLSPQFWIDPVKLVVVRVLIPLAPDQPPLDVHLEQYIETGGGWLATKVTMFQGGAPRQMEEYSAIKTGHAIADSVFEMPLKVP